MDSVKQACSDLVKGLIWWQVEPDHSEIDYDLDEFVAMTNKLYEIAMGELPRIESLENSEQVLESAIRYIDRTHSAPQLRGQFAWFGETLGALLEICNPNTLLSPNELKFLEYLENGIRHYRETALDS